MFCAIPLCPKCYLKFKDHHYNPAPTKMTAANLPLFLVAFSPLLFLFSFIYSRFDSGLRPQKLLRLVTFSAATAILASILAVITLVKIGPVQSTLLGFSGLGISFRLDPLSVLMFSMIALLAFIIIKFSKNYLDGDDRQGIFMGRLSATIASVQLLVLSGNIVMLFISWVLTSLTLHQLLVFYKERPKARLAARKKFIVARLGDLFLAFACIALYLETGTGDLELIFNYFASDALNTAGSGWIEIAAVALALTAILKSAQFPTHGWLVEVMETPTPVSALLHAGILNAGPYLMARMAYVMSPSDLGPVLLVIFGGFTAFFASVSFLTQTSIKTALGYSSIAHMGFMLMVCGMGLYSAAMLHLVAHSFYKAHAFLSSGSTIDEIRSKGVQLPKRLGSPVRIAISFFAAIGIYTLFAMLWGVHVTEEPALFMAGIIIILGLSQIIVPAIDSAGYFKTMAGACLMAVAVSVSFFTLEHATSAILSTQIPAMHDPGSVVIALSTTLLMLFGAAILSQSLAPVLRSGSFWRKLGIHFRNGFYANALFDRLVGALETSQNSGSNKPGSY